MNPIRMQIEDLQKRSLSEKAQLVTESRGRKYPEEKDEIRTDFQRDRDRILYSKAFRRLKHKTQVFISPEGDHYRTRLTHTLEVSQIGRTIARALGLNEDLVEAIALGHDVGHTPFGHAGEYVLQKIFPGFQHAHQSVRVLEFLETRNKESAPPGLNLTWEVLDGIENHSGGGKAHTDEGRLIKFADRIAYVNHDIDDSIRAGILKEEDLPVECTRVLGHSPSDRIDTMVKAVIAEFEENGKIGMKEPFYTASRTLRKFMFQNVYTNDTVKSENAKLVKIIEDLLHYYINHPQDLPIEFRKLYVGEHANDSMVVRAADYVAGMTDTFLIHSYEEIFIPKVWTKI